ncbi:MAG: SMC-Scp complex subunit ScpB [Thermoguttaceae bacterium]|jgi:segregation and condensation protein B
MSEEDRSQDKKTEELNPQIVAQTDDAKRVEEVEEEDDFFSKSFFFGSSQNDYEKYGAAFAEGLRSVFEADDDEEEESETAEDISDADRIQRELEFERREALDSVIMQNDADFLYEAGSKYEAPRSTDDSPDRRSKKSASSNNKSSFYRAVVRPESILEAMLFVGDRENKPLPLKRACELIRNVSEMEAIEILADLNERYIRTDAPYRIIRDGEGFRLALLDSFDDVVERFAGKTKEFKMSQTAIEALAIVAYRQPISFDEIIKVRGNAAGALSQLVRRNLVTVEKQQTAGKKRISVYRTTERFLKLFNLKSIDELPVIGDVDYR